MRKYKDELIALLRQYKPYNQDDAQSLFLTLEFLNNNDDVFGNSNEKGHITASVWLLDFEYKNVLLTHHKKLNRWLQLGGHTESNENIHEAALREAMEESGLKELEFLTIQVFDVDVHEIPARSNLPAHFHYDIRFIIHQKIREEISISDESIDLKWIKIEEVPLYSDSPSITRMVDKMIKDKFVI